LSSPELEYPLRLAFDLSVGKAACGTKWMHESESMPIIPSYFKEEYLGYAEKLVPLILSSTTEFYQEL
jgi:hypothetical protein